ncbi:hypothetical protein [Cellulomonas triticagri]|uniref:Uncharacterized protein n=1 Tax=Cellulomonas triticagri TaxID=2483352 RepID=A0A3M2JQG2_9CELL|nr:hypothetical protein [Cellulomonas triticagri]RMI13883.1 hypothetical protein EBM89_02620 [Cellulomonas triticagri]
MDLSDPRTVGTAPTVDDDGEARRWRLARQTATRVVCSHAHDAADARDLLELLGLAPSEDDGESTDAAPEQDGGPNKRPRAALQASTP